MGFREAMRKAKERPRETVVEIEGEQCVLKRASPEEVVTASQVAIGGDTALFMGALIAISAWDGDERPWNTPTGAREVVDTLTPGDLAYVFGEASKINGLDVGNSPRASGSPTDSVSPLESSVPNDYTTN